MHIQPRPQIILMGKDEGTAEVCAEFGLQHVPGIECNEFGTPLVNSVISRAEIAAEFDLMLLISTDIILLDDFIDAARRVSQSIKHFCAVAIRRELNLRQSIDFDDPHWSQNIRRSIDLSLPMNQAAGDAFLYPKGFWRVMPPFAVGRTAVDGWLFFRTLDTGAALVDLTPSVTVIHQAHDHSHHPQGLEGVYHGDEAQRNLKLAGGFEHCFYISDANWVLTSRGLEKPKLTRKRLRRMMDTFPALHPRLSWLALIVKFILFPREHPISYFFFRLARVLASPRRFVQAVARRIT